MNFKRYFKFDWNFRRNFQKGNKKFDFGRILRKSSEEIKIKTKICDIKIKFYVDIRGLGNLLGVVGLVLVDFTLLLTSVLENLE